MVTEMITVKLETGFLREIDKTVAVNGYQNRTEFIRDAIREKLSELEQKNILKGIARLKGSSTKKTSDEQLHIARERAFKELEKKFGIK